SRAASSTRGAARLSGSVARSFIVGALLLGSASQASVTAAAQQADPSSAEEQVVNPGLGKAPEGLERGTPEASWRALFELGSRGDFANAAHLLDLSEVPVEQQREVGPAVAEKLYQVVRVLDGRKDHLPGDLQRGAPSERRSGHSVTALRSDKAGLFAVELARVGGGPGQPPVWLFTPGTVSSVPLVHRVLVEKGPMVGQRPLNPGLGQAPAEVGRSSPREAYSGFLEAAREGRFDVAAHYLDLSGIEEARQQGEGARLARRLMFVLTTALWLDPATISDRPTGTPQLDVAENEERLGTVRLVRRDVGIVLAYRLDDARKPIWTFSSQTVQSIDAMYRVHGLGWIGDRLPVDFFTIEFAGLQLWQWVVLLLAVVAGWMVSRPVGRWIARLACYLARRTSLGWDDVVATSLNGPASFLLWSVLLLLASRLAGLNPEARAVAGVIWKLLALLGIGWFLVRMVDGFVDHAQRAAGESNQVGIGFLPVMSRFAKSAVALLIFLGVLDVLGVNVVGLVAGVGIAGAAIAFAAQKTLENLFGTVTIAGDRPFKVGDTIAIGTDLGTVEDIGLRSIRLRTLAHTLVTIPNGVVVAGRVENLSARERILYGQTIGLVYSTTKAQLELVIDEIKRVLIAHPKVYQEQLRVRLKAFGASSLDVEVVCWVTTTDFHEYTAVAEELNFAILGIVEAAGTSMAFPSTSVYMASNEAADPDAAAAAAREVEARRARGELLVPEPPPGIAEKLRSSKQRG
ncbi:MAG: mechanosensitive ion channel family protein, partial [Acidobacteriota bacterium]